MKIFYAFALIYTSIFTNTEVINSGQYTDQLHLAFNPSNNIITGYFESYSGYDQETKSPRFSCIFYIEGKLRNNIANIKTYYPLDKKIDLIEGTLKVVNHSKISIQLPYDHGGCWNVQQFADNPLDFELSEKKNWLEIRYISSEKSWFYSNKSEASKRKAYVIKGDIVFIDKIEEGWIHCKYHSTEGWIKSETVNK